MKKSIISTITVLLFAAGSAAAQQEVTMRINAGMPPVAFALPPFLSSPATKTKADEIQAVLEADIKYTRIFELLPKAHYGYIKALIDYKNPDFKEWESIQANVLFTARVEGAPDGGIIFEWLLLDVKSRRSIVGKSWQYKETNLRKLAHMAADEIMKAYGEKPLFNSKIAFVSTRDKNDSGKNEDLYIMDYDGFNQTRITHRPENESNPTWDPEAKRLAYSAWQNNTVIYIIDVYEGKRTMVSQKGQNFTPAWSPDGKKLAFSSSMDGNQEIYIAEIEANPTRVGKITRLTFHPEADSAPSWSHDGRQIVFTSDRGGSTQIYIMNAEGGNPRRISTGSNHHDAPAWSPNGDKIVYVARVDSIFDLYFYNVRTGQISKLTESNALNESPSWSPDGRHIIFTSNKSGTRQLHVLDADGLNLRQLTFKGENKLGKWSH